MNMQNKWYTI